MSKKLEAIQLITRKMAETFRNLNALCLRKLQQLEQLEKHQLLDESDQQERDSVQIKPSKQPQVLHQKDLQKSKQEDDHKKKKKKTTRVIDPNKPKQPVSTFIMFCQDQKQLISQTYPQFSIAEVTKIASKCWKDLSEEEKEPYNRRYNLQKKKYEQQMVRYRLSHPEETKIKKQQKETKKNHKNQEKIMTIKAQNNSRKGSDKIEQQQSLQQDNKQVQAPQVENESNENKIESNISRSDPFGVLN